MHLYLVWGGRDILSMHLSKGFPWVIGRESTCHCWNHIRHGFNPESGRFWELNGNLLQYSGLERIPWTERSSGYSAWCHKSIPHNWTHIKTHRAVHQEELILLFIKLKNKSRTWLSHWITTNFKIKQLWKIEWIGLPTGNVSFSLV